MAIRNARVCVRCATSVIDPLAIGCPSCQSTDLSERHSRPRYVAPTNVIQMPFPFDGVRIGQGKTILLAGDKGSGKTTICMRLHPTRIATSEQEADAVAQTWYRVNGEDSAPPTISHCYTFEQLLEDIEGLEEDELVLVDSVAQFAAVHEQTEIMHACIEAIRKAKARGIFITQFNASGEPFGVNELQHAVDVVLIIDTDDGMRRLSATKDRGGPVSARYFRLTGAGPVPETFEYGYTVEGNAGRYRLHLYPYPGAKYAGIMDTLAKAGATLHRRCSAAIECRGYTHGYAEPSDVSDRRRFAESHNLEWVSPEDCARLLDEAGSDPLT